MERRGATGRGAARRGAGRGAARRTGACRRGGVTVDLRDKEGRRRLCASRSPTMRPPTRRRRGNAFLRSVPIMTPPFSGRLPTWGLPAPLSYQRPCQPVSEHSRRTHMNTTPFVSTFCIVIDDRASPSPATASCPIPGTIGSRVSPLEDRSRSRRGCEPRGHDRFLQLTHPHGSLGEPT